VALGPGEPEALRTRSLCIQYRESDWAFVQRLLASEGLSWHIEHLGKTTPPPPTSRARPAM
jgi:uncharacterized protein involved in type VI secretion and phage assembly